MRDEGEKKKIKGEKQGSDISTIRKIINYTTVSPRIDDDSYTTFWRSLGFGIDFNCELLSACQAELSMIPSHTRSNNKLNWKREARRKGY